MRCVTAQDKTAEKIMSLYPRVFFACHTKPLGDAESKGISPHLAAILDHLDDGREVTVSDLASRMGVTVGTMSLHVEKLTALGFIVRKRDTADRRKVFLAITPAGGKVRQTQSVLDADRVGALLGMLSPAQRVTAVRGLELLARAASGMKAASVGKDHPRIPSGANAGPAGGKAPA
jgi:MarR family transcriptional regulator, organic hydroperoxide resistance regulator